MSLLSCSDKPEDINAQLAAMSPCNNTNLGITEVSRHPWPTETTMIDQSENFWHWKKSNDTLYIFMSQWGIDSKITTEYAFLAKPGTCLEPKKLSSRDTFEEWSNNGATPTIYEVPFSGTVQYYVENLLFVGRLVAANPDFPQDVWVDLKPDNERPDYNIKNMGNQ